MEVGEREAGICDQHFYHGECGCPCHRAPLPVVALLRGAPHEATAEGARVLSPMVDAMAYGVRRTPSSRARSVGSSCIPKASPEHVGVYPAPITMPTERVLLLHRIVLGGPCASATWCQVVGSVEGGHPGWIESASNSGASSSRCAPGIVFRIA